MTQYWSLCRTLAGQAAQILQKALVKIINDSVCDVVTEGQVTSRMLCSGYLSGGVDACQVRLCAHFLKAWKKKNNLLMWADRIQMQSNNHSPPTVITRVTLEAPWCASKRAGSGSRRALWAGERAALVGTSLVSTRASPSSENGLNRRQIFDVCVGNWLGCRVNPSCCSRSSVL